MPEGVPYQFHVRVEAVDASTLAQSFEDLSLDERESCFELLKAGVAYYLNGVSSETEPEMILFVQDAMQMVKEFPFEVTIHELMVVVSDEDRERAAWRDESQQT